MNIKRLFYHLSILGMVLVVLTGSIDFSLSNISKLEKTSTAAVYEPNGGKALCLIEGSAHSFKEWHQRLMIAFHAMQGPFSAPAQQDDAEGHRT